MRTAERDGRSLAGRLAPLGLAGDALTRVGGGVARGRASRSPASCSDGSDAACSGR